MPDEPTRDIDEELRRLERRALAGDDDALGEYETAVRDADGAQAGTDARRLVEIARRKAGIPLPSRLEWLIRDWSDGDLRRDREHFGGYEPAAGVLANRERGRQEEEIEAVGRRALGPSDFWSDAGYDERGPVVDVGSRDNRIRPVWEERMRRLASAIAGAGYRVREDREEATGRLLGLSVELDRALTREAHDAHADYVRALKARASREGRRP